MKEKPNKSSGLTTFLLIVIFMIGLSLLLYPTVANYWNSKHQTRAIATYSETVAQIDDTRYAEMWEEAKAFNATIPQRVNHSYLPDEDRPLYEAALNLGGSGVMGYVEIPEIDVTLPIYHGTSDSVLQRAVGHLDWTGLPIGEPGTHCVFSGHRGLPSAKLFTHLDKLVEGDVFILRILNEVMTYEVDQILIVEPQDISALQVVEGEDLCTLVTCTPYGINTHRLLVRGHRIENAEEAKAIIITSEMLQVDEMIVATVLAVPILLLLVLFVLLRKNGNRKDIDIEGIKKLLKSLDED